jgi:hypothetical protein
MQAVDQRRMPPGRIKDGKQRFFMQAPKLGPTQLPVNPAAFQNGADSEYSGFSVVPTPDALEIGQKWELDENPERYRFYT